MRFDDLYLWYLADPALPRYVGQLRLVEAGKGVSLQYGADWLEGGFALSEDLVLTDIEQLPRWKGMAVGAVDDVGAAGIEHGVGTPGGAALPCWSAKHHVGIACE